MERRNYTLLKINFLTKVNYLLDYSIERYFEKWSAFRKTKENLNYTRWTYLYDYLAHINNPWQTHCYLLYLHGPDYRAAGRTALRHCPGAGFILWLWRQQSSATWCRRRSSSFISGTYLLGCANAASGGMRRSPGWRKKPTWKAGWCASTVQSVFASWWPFRCREPAPGPAHWWLRYWTCGWKVPFPPFSWGCVSRRPLWPP